MQLTSLKLQSYWNASSFRINYFLLILLKTNLLKSKFEEFKLKLLTRFNPRVEKALTVQYN